MEPTKFPSINEGCEVYHSQNCGPCFGQNYDIGNNNFSNIYITNFPKSYKDVLGFGCSIFTGDLDNNNNCIKVQQIVVYKIIEK